MAPLPAIPEPETVTKAVLLNCCPLTSKAALLLTVRPPAPVPKATGLPAFKTPWAAIMGPTKELLDALSVRVFAPFCESGPEPEIVFATETLSLRLKTREPAAAIFTFEDPRLPADPPFPTCRFP